ncbi:FkbM family methyltransferase [Hephaestia caeni]|uniref:FkbM family methyltransferase n=1 Tax=Hephaestia caeni TaxID=645617 RepID=A0A397PD19_9SPHN|nr:FkbM family methyltransferase [Hephaestia caeni]RIA46303.1 FkbM family methyltransferase [Hephaestia caeni]
MSRADEPAPPELQPRADHPRRPGILDVRRGFQLFLGRELESVAVAGVHIANAPDVWDLVEAIWGSPEARNRRLAESLRIVRSAHDFVSPECNASARQLDDLYRSTFDRWRQHGLGKYHRELSRDEVRFGARSDRWNLEHSLERGKTEWADLQRMLGRLGWRGGSAEAVTVVGVEAFRMLGAGRQTASQLVAIEMLERDVARGHRAEELAQAQAAQLTCLADLPGDLPATALLYAVSSLQYAPPPVIIDLLRRCLGSVTIGGCAVVQLPAYLHGYSFDIVAYLSGDDETVWREFHCIPQAEILSLFAGKGFRLLEVIPDEKASIFGFSYTYVAERIGAGTRLLVSTGTAEQGYAPDAGSHKIRKPVEGTDLGDLDAFIVSEWIVQLLYRSLLGRDADSEGLAHYANMIRHGALHDQTLTANLIGSPEYQQASGAIAAGHVEVESHGCRLLMPAEPVPKHGNEPWALPYMLDECRPGSVVLDLAAGRGLFSIPAAKHVRPEGRVYAIEPCPLNCQIIAHNITLNQLDNVELLPIELASLLGDERAGRSSAIGGSVLDDAGSAAFSDSSSRDAAPVISLDRLRPLLRKVDVIKVNATDGEYRASLGAIELIRGDRPTIFLEYAHLLQDGLSETLATEVLKLFAELGYGFEILHREQPRQLVGSGHVVQTIHQASKAWVRAGGSLLQLCLRPLKSPF